MLRRPLPSTLFPYTTLFRSNSYAACFGFGGLINVTPDVGSGMFARNSNLTFAEDRKSTRLNSSHVAISYAVFCLKKKMNQIVNAGLLGMPIGSETYEHRARV